LNLFSADVCTRMAIPHGLALVCLGIISMRFGTELGEIALIVRVSGNYAFPDRIPGNIMGFL